MPDITLCRNHKCEAKYKCYRFTAIPDDIAQSYFAGEVGKDENCEYFMADKKDIEK